MTVTTYNVNGRRVYLPERAVEPADCWETYRAGPKDTGALRREFIKDNPAVLIEYLEGYDKTLIDDFIFTNRLDYRRWLDGYPAC